jgi:hypothetical protein
VGPNPGIKLITGEQIAVCFDFRQFLGEISLVSPPNHKELAATLAMPQPLQFNNAPSQAIWTPVHC